MDSLSLFCYKLSIFFQSVNNGYVVKNGRKECLGYSAHIKHSSRLITQNFKHFVGLLAFTGGVAGPATDPCHLFNSSCFYEPLCPSVLKQSLSIKALNQEVSFAQEILYNTLRLL